MGLGLLGLWGSGFRVTEVYGFGVCRVWVWDSQGLGLGALCSGMVYVFGV